MFVYNFLPIFVVVTSFQFSPWIVFSTIFHVLKFLASFLFCFLLFNCKCKVIFWVMFSKHHQLMPKIFSVSNLEIITMKNWCATMLFSLSRFTFSMNFYEKRKLLIAFCLTVFWGIYSCSKVHFPFFLSRRRFTAKNVLFRLSRDHHQVYDSRSAQLTHFHNFAW